MTSHIASKLNFPGLAMGVGFIVLFVPIAYAVDLPASTTPGAWQAIINANGAGTSYTVKAGVSRLQSVTPQNGDIFIGEPGAIMKGSKVLGPATQDTANPALWKWTGQTQKHNASGAWEDAGTDGNEQAVYYGNELFVNGKRQRHVNTKADVVSDGQWFFDYAAQTIYIYGNPANKLVEASVTPGAFLLGGKSNVTIRNFTIQHYAGCARNIGGAVKAGGSTGTIIRNMDVSYNHAGGLENGDNMTVENSRFTHNGQIGVVGGINHTPINWKNNELAFNAGIGFGSGEAGAMKISSSHGGYFANTWLHDNQQWSGIWFDVYNQNYKIYSNLIERANRSIFYEISGGDDDATTVETLPYTEIYWNIARDFTDSGVDLSSSKRVKVYGNAFSGRLSGGGKGMWLRNDPARLPNLGEVQVYDNDTMLWYNGKHLQVNYTSPSQITSITGNKYKGVNQWNMLGTTENFTQWQSHGYDTTGTFTSSVAVEPSLPAGATPFSYSNYGPPAQSRMLQLRLDESRESLARDLSGTGLTGTVMNGSAVTVPANTTTAATGPKPGPAYMGFGMDFDGTDDYITIPHSSALNATDDKVSIMAWVKMDNITGQRTIASKYPSYELSIRDGKPRLELVVSTGTSTNIAFSAQTTSAHVPVGQWVHIAAVRAGATVTLYVNGVSQPVSYLNTPTTANIQNNSNALRVAMRNNGFLPFDGFIDELEIYRRALSVDEVRMSMK